jgi:hypothetical protein
MEPLSGKREPQPDRDSPAIVIGTGAARGIDDGILSTARTANALIHWISPAPARSPQRAGFPYRTKVPFHFAVAAVIVSHAAVANGL